MIIIKKFKQLYKFIQSFSDTSIDYKIRSNQLLIDAKNSNTRLTETFLNGNIELIVSFTTYSKRIHNVHLVIESIAHQTVKPNRLILWLDKDEFSLDTIPLVLHRQINRGLEVRFCPNHRSYKKLIPTLQEFPEADVITIDDDVLYPYDMIEMLCKEHQQYPQCILGHQLHKLKFSLNGQILPYKKWTHDVVDSVPSLQNMAIGIGGVFYPAKCLSEEVLNIDKFTELAPFADDIWFKAMSLLNERTHKKINDDRPFKSRFLVIPDGQDIALYNINLLKGGNDTQINSVFGYYNLYKKLSC